MSSCKRVEPLASTTLSQSAARTLSYALSLGYTKYSRFNLSSASSTSGQPSSLSVYQLITLVPSITESEEYISAYATPAQVHSLQYHSTVPASLPSQATDN